MVPRYAWEKKLENSVKFKIVCLLLLTSMQAGCGKQQGGCPIKAQQATETQHPVAVVPAAPQTSSAVTPAHISTPAATQAPTPANCPSHTQTKAQVVPTPEPQAMLDLPKNATPPVVDLWQPNEAQLARGSELILGLQEEYKRSPTAHEMQKRLQTHMGLSPTQAQKVIVALGHQVGD